MNDFTMVARIEWATHWVPKEAFDENGLTLGKAYRIYETEIERYIIIGDDEGIVCDPWIYIEGEYRNYILLNN